MALPDRGGPSYTGIFGRLRRPKIPVKVWLHGLIERNKFDNPYYGLSNLFYKKKGAVCPFFYPTKSNHHLPIYTN